MLKKNFLFLSLIFLTNCSTPSTAFGSIFTGAKTGSVYQASISYSSNVVIKRLENLKKNKL